jgi:hypothetical protein
MTSTVTTFLLNLKTFLLCLFLFSITAIVVEGGYLVWAGLIDPKRSEERTLELKAIDRCVEKVRQSIHALYADLDELERRAAKYVAGIKAGEAASALVRDQIEKLREYIEGMRVEHGVMLAGK